MSQFFLSIILFAGEFLPLEEIKPGMEGIGKTVFEGTKIDTFRVKIIGILKNVRPKSDIILAELSGGPLEKTGVIEGMSGSPIYINNKLVGALAYRFGIFTLKPIGGITPISEMLEMSGKKGGKHTYGSERTTSLIPIRIPLTITGAQQNILTPEFDKFWRKLGGTPVIGGKVSSSPPFSLEPGAAIGIEIMRGDLSITAMGTLTYVKGDKIVAFGHSFWEEGETEYPLCFGYVHSILPSQYSSYKISAPLATIGKITQDYYAGISGKIGEYAEMLPLEITTKETHYNFELLKSSRVTPILVTIAAANTLYLEEGTPSSLTLRAKTCVETTDHSPIEWKEIFSGGNAIKDMAFRIYDNIHALIHNPFEKIQLKKIKMEIKTSPKNERAEILNIRAEKEKTVPGESLKLTVLIQVEEKGIEEKSITIKVPHGIDSKELLIIATNGDSSLTLKNRGIFNIEQFLERLEEKPPNNELVILVFEEKEGVVIEGKPLPLPPPSLSRLIKHTKPVTSHIYPSKKSLLLEERISTPYHLSGKKTLKISVKKE